MKRPKIPDPRIFVGRKIVKRMPDESLRKGVVLKLRNMEGLNTMFLVEFEDATEYFRLIYDYINEDLWIDEEEEEEIDIHIHPATRR